MPKCSPRANEILTKEFLEQAFINDRMTANAIADREGFTRHVVEYRIKKYGLRCDSRRQNMVGRVFGKLTVTQFDTSKRKTKRHAKCLECICSCGNTTHVTARNLTTGNTTSCGCSQYKRGPNSPYWKGHGQISGAYWYRIQKNAEARGHKLTVTIQEAWELYLRQNRVCALTGWPIDIPSNPHDEQTASLDRIDSTQEYIPSNIQWVHKDINTSKWDYPQDYYIKMCHAVANTNPLPAEN